jgi:hypothetical protein
VSKNEHQFFSISFDSISQKISILGKTYLGISDDLDTVPMYGARILYANEKNNKLTNIAFLGFSKNREKITDPIGDVGNFKANFKKQKNKYLYIIYDGMSIMKFKIL